MFALGMCSTRPSSPFARVDVPRRFAGLIREVCPLYELLTGWPEVPNPFIRCCILQYVAFTRSSSDEDLAAHTRLLSVIQENMTALESSNPSPSLVIGLLIASLSPLSGFEKRFQRNVDSGQMIGRAEVFAHAMGLDDVVSRAMQETQRDLVSAPWLRPLLDKLALVRMCGDDLTVRSNVAVVLRRAPLCMVSALAVRSRLDAHVYKVRLVR
jgi:hypothetical protein